MSGPAPYPLPRKDALILRESATVIRTAAGEVYVEFAGGRAGRARYRALQRYKRYSRLASELDRIAGAPP